MCPRPLRTLSLRAPGCSSIARTQRPEKQLQEADTGAGTVPRMEKDSPSKPSVAELAGRFKGHILPMPTPNDAPPFRRRPPCSLKLHNQKENDNENAQKPLTSPSPLKVRTRNSALIEKLQANLALSPTALLPSPKSPDVKLPPAPLSPTSSSPQTPHSPALSPGLSPALSPGLSPGLGPGLRPSQQSSEEKDRVSFETPAEGTTLPSLHKTRARLSFKRRPPTRQHRRSTQDDEEDEDEEPASAQSLCEPSSPNENGLREQVFDSPAPEGAEVAPVQDVPEKDTDCDMIEGEEAAAARSHPDDATAGSEVQEQQPSQPCPAECEGAEAKEEETTEEAARGEKE